MDITNSLLVAMMFIVMLTIGIGNIIMSLAATIDRRSPFRFDRFHTSWMLLLLLLYFDLFWHVLDILTIENWTFLGFLYTISGAVIVLFASQLLLPDAASESAADPRGHYFDTSRQFFLFLALLQAWEIGVDLLFGGGLSFLNGFNVVAALIFLTLASSKTEKVHAIGSVAAWVIFLAAVVLQGMGIPSPA